MIDKKTILEAINKLGINDKSVCIHSSLKSFGYVEGGAKTIVQTFIDADCTVLVPAFSDMFEAYPPKHLRPERNGAGDYSYFENKEYGTPGIFITDCNEITKEEMGIIPHTILNMDSRKRGYNPLNSFAAVGKHADTLVKNQTAEDVYAPLQELCNQNGFILLMGVNLDNATIIHYAEQVAGRKPFIRWANCLQGKAAVVSAGGCSDGFNSFSDMLKPIEKVVTVGKSLWRCFPASEMVEICSKAIIETPDITHCHNPYCDRCNDAVLGGPIW
jgi:aminoglycoside N3'-acetyltransferase